MPEHLHVGLRQRLQLGALRLGALAQAARDQGLRVDDAQLDRALARIAEQNRLTPSQLRTQIERDGMNYVRFREDIRDEILVSRLREREVDAKVVISEADVDAWLADQGTATPEEVEVAETAWKVARADADAARINLRLIGERGWRLVYGGGRAGLMGTVADAALAS